MKSKTIILGATPNPARTAFQAVHTLQRIEEELFLVGIRAGEVGGLFIRNTPEAQAEIPEVDTVTLYIGAKHQASWFDFVLSKSPKRVIFNPGTENPEFITLLKGNGIDAIEACTLVLVAVGEYKKL
ncbi:MAG: CoA-binding protein [Bacteroidota bacterium]